MVFETKHGKSKMGERPFLYSPNPTRAMCKPVYSNRYTLVTGDSFETGAAYSLHLKRKDAEKYKVDDWWSLIYTGVGVFVSKSTLEKIADNGGNVFRSWEH